MNTHFHTQTILAFAISVISSLLVANSSVAQIQTLDQLADIVVSEFRNVSQGSRRVAVRDFRVPCSIATELTNTVKSRLKAKGFQVSLVADYEIEGRIKTSTDYQGIQRDVLKLKIITPYGTDRTQQFSITPGLVDVSCKNAKKEPETATPADNSIKVPESNTKAGRHQIYPSEEWKFYNVSSNILHHAKNGFITNRGDWNTFWAQCNLAVPMPNVDFQKQFIRVETVPYPQTINAEIFSIGNGSIDITKDISNDAPAGTGMLNGHILIINKSDIQQKRKVRLGVTIDARHENRGVVITSVVPNSPITRGRLDDGRNVALEPGDVIYSLDGISTNTVGGFASLIQSSRGLLRAEVKNVQNGEVIYVTFELN